MRKFILFFLIISFVALLAGTSCNNRREGDEGTTYTSADTAAYLDSVAKAKGDSTHK
jgi:hypothetical protein